MRTRSTFLVLWAALFLLGAGLSACGTSEDEGEEAGMQPPTVAGGTATAPTREPAAGRLPESDFPNGIAVDANPDSPDIDSSTVQPLAEPFDVAVNVTSVGTEYNAYQFMLAWDSSILSFVSGEHLSPDDFDICFAFTLTDGGVSTSCGRRGGGSAHVGVVDRVTLQCEEEGTTVLHFATLEDDPRFGTTSLSPVGEVIPMDAADASVTCR